MSRSKDALPYDVAASDITDFSVAGYLDKKRPSKTFMSIKYQRRWCVVYGNYFMYYTSPDEKAQRGSFSLKGYKFLASPGVGDYGFSLISREKRPFEFIAHSEEDFNRWKGAIKKGIELTKRQIAPITALKQQCKETEDSQIYNSRSASNVNSNTLPTRSSSPSLLMNAKLPPRSVSPNPMQNNATKHATLPCRSTSPLPTQRDFNKHPPPRPKAPPNIHGSPQRGVMAIQGSPTSDNGGYDNQSNLYAKPFRNPNASQPKKQSPKLPHKQPFKQSPVLTTRPTIEDRDSESTSDSLDISDTDDDDDNEGYIRTDKLNCPRINKPERTEKAVSYTADDYMTVLPDILPPLPSAKSKTKSVDNCGSSSNESDKVDSRNRTTQEDDYMIVLPDNVNKIFIHDENPYSSVEADTSKKISDLNENHIDKTMYHSVKRAPPIGLIDQRSESDYASVDALDVNLPKQRPIDYDSDSSSDDDYVNQNGVEQYSRVDTILLPTKKNTPRRVIHDSEDSSSSNESDDSSSSIDDYEKVDELKKIDDEIKSDVSEDTNKLYEKPIPAKRKGIGNPSKSETHDPIYANFN